MNVVQGKIKPLNDNVLATDMNFGEQTSKGGIVLMSDDGKSEGIKPRWCRVWAVGPKQTDVKVGDWIFVEHGRWTRGVTVEDENGDELIIRRIDTNAIIGVSDSKPEGLEVGNFSAPEHGSTHRPEDFIRPH